MNAALVRYGGISIALASVLLIAVPLVLRDSAGQLPMFTAVALITFGMWETKALFNARGYTKANRAVPAVICATLIFASLALFEVNFGPEGLKKGQTSAIIALVVAIAVVLAWLWFGVRSFGFAKIGGGLWLAVGTLYVAAISALAVSLTVVIPTMPKGYALLAAIIGLLGRLIMLVGMTVHGIGLVLGARAVVGGSGSSNLTPQTQDRQEREPVGTIWSSRRTSVAIGVVLGVVTFGAALMVWNFVGPIRIGPWLKVAIIIGAAVLGGALAYIIERAKES